jgi:hypothetical protein
MLLVILVSAAVSQRVEEFLQMASWSSTSVGTVLGESDYVGASGGKDVLDVGLREPAVSAVA